ncbi:MAG: hypothetical protein ACR2F6_12250 [Mycobacteriales bacterium]
MPVLQAVAEHRSVDLIEQPVVDLDDEVGWDAADVAVVRRVVDLAEGQAVGDHRLTARMSVGQDAGGVEELAVADPAHRAARLEGHHDLAGEARPSGSGVAARTVVRLYIAHKEQVLHTYSQMAKGWLQSRHAVHTLSP